MYAYPNGHLIKKTEIMQANRVPSIGTFSYVKIEIHELTDDNTKGERYLYISGEEIPIKPVRKYFSTRRNFVGFSSLFNKGGQFGLGHPRSWTTSKTKIRSYEKHINRIEIPRRGIINLLVSYDAKKDVFFDFNYDLTKAGKMHAYANTYLFIRPFGFDLLIKKDNDVIPLLQIVTKEGISSKKYYKGIDIEAISVLLPNMWRMAFEEGEGK